MNFQRGLDPKAAMGIGLDAILKEIGGVIINDKGQIGRWRTEDKWAAAGLTLEDEEKELAKNDLRKKNVIIGVSDGQFNILRNKLKYDGPDKGDEKDLIKVLLDLRECFRKYGTDFVWFPNMQNVTARTIGLDLVPVQPMSAPIGLLTYLDYKYDNTKIGIKKIKKRKHKK